MENLENTLPKDFVKNLKSELGEDYKKYITAMAQKSARGLHVNTKKISVPEFLKIFSEPLESLLYSKDGLILNSDEKLGNSAEHLAGLYYLQEPSSMLAVCLSGLGEETRPLKVLDLCAAPGGKTSQIACFLSDESILISNEKISSRANVLFSNVERQGFKNVVVTNENPENLLDFENYFDYVFVDAPCSGEGMFRKNPETILEWSMENVEICSKRQKEILEIAQKLVKPGGKLVYSTCTFNKSEDEEIVEWFLNSFDFQPQKFSNNFAAYPVKINGKIADFALKFYPFCGAGEGQFVALLSKVGDENLNDNKKFYNSKRKNIFALSKSELALFDEFCKINLKSKPKGKLARVGETIYLLPEAADEELLSKLDSKKFVTAGVKVGYIKNKRFEPHHSFFMAFGESFAEKKELDDKNLKKYLHGEELNLENSQNKKCYACVTAGGYAVGGGKLTGGKLKNLYPKGLRQ